MDKWTQQLHDKLAEREVAPPNDLWADIEAALPKDLAGSKKPRARFVPLRRWAVAATLALLVVGGGYLFWHSSNPEAPTSTPTPYTPQPELSQADPKVLTESQKNHGDWLNDSSAAEIRVPVPVILCLQALLSWMDAHDLQVLHSSTQIIIAPGYDYKIVKMLVTNFHQPQSTLLLLVSAFVKGDWRKIYDYALSHDFRFLSYGDSSLLIP